EDYQLTVALRISGKLTPPSAITGNKPHPAKLKAVWRINHLPTVTHPSFMVTSATTPRSTAITPIITAQSCAIETRRHKIAQKNPQHMKNNTTTVAIDPPPNMQQNARQLSAPNTYTSRPSPLVAVSIQ